MRNTTKNIRTLQRVKHFHNQRIVRNDRYWCDVCGYAWPRRIFYANGKSPFSKESRFKRAVLNAQAHNQDNPISKQINLDNLTVPVLREWVSKRRPDIKGISKMRKAELVSALRDS